jgi:glutathione synthase/RimK-type ligase-like ATP-grasp enzyme
MKIAIHPLKGSFSDRWVVYCKNNSIEYKIVNCYESDIIQQLSDCDALMWHFHHERFKDHLFARQLLTSLHMAGKRVFPDFNSFWHFDDKIAQKYLLESLGLPLVTSYVFYNKCSSLDWAVKTKYPIVFKQRRGAGSKNVKLIKNYKEAKKVISKAFGKGFPVFDKWGYFKERMRRTKAGLDPWTGALKGFARLFVKPKDLKKFPNERGYVYFQDYIPDNNSDTRIIVIGNKAFAIKRINRENDFRASGSGIIKYEKEEFDERCVTIAFDASKRLNASCMTYDFVFSLTNEPIIVEISYGFKVHGYDPCTGFWDSNLIWHQGKFNPQAWMVEELLKKIS